MKMRFIFFVVLMCFSFSACTESEVNSADGVEPDSLVAGGFGILMDELEQVRDGLSEDRRSEQSWARYKTLVEKEEDNLEDMALDSSASEQALVEKITSQLETATLLLEQGKQGELQALRKDEIAPTLEQIRNEFEVKNISVKEVFRDPAAFESVFPDIEDDELGEFFSPWKTKIEDAAKTLQVDLSGCYAITREDAPVNSDALKQCGLEVEGLSLAKRDEAKGILVDYMNTLASEVENRLASVRDGIADSEGRMDQLIEKISESGEEIPAPETDEPAGDKAEREENAGGSGAREVHLIGYMLIAFVVITFIVLIMGVVIFGMKKKFDWRDDSSGYPLFLELVTFFVLALVLLILGLADKINSMVLVTLISTMSGYILGRLKEKPSGADRRRDDPSPANPDQSATKESSRRSTGKRASASDKQGVTTPAQP